MIKLHIFLLLFSIASFSQTADLESKLSALQNIIENTGLSKDKQEQLGYLIKENQRLLKEFELDVKYQNSNSILYYWDKRFSKESINRGFMKGIVDILSQNEFRKFFDQQISRAANRNLTSHLKRSKSKFELTANQQKKLEEVLLPFYEKIAFSELYFRYDPDLEYQKTKGIELDLDTIYHETLASFGFNSLDVFAIDSPRIKKFETKALELGISQTTINKIIKVVVLKNKRMIDHDRNWAKIESESIFHFYDVATSKENIQKDFVFELSKLITFKEFKDLFKEELVVQINRELKSKIQEFKTVYSPTNDQLKQVQSTLNSNAIEEVCTDEYYKYDYDLAYLKRQEVVEIYSIPRLKQKLKDIDLSYKRANGKSVIESDKIEKFRVDARQAGISSNTIETILTLLSEYDSKNDRRNEKWLKNKKTYVFEFYHEYEGEESLKRILRNKIQNILTLEQFSKLFSEQLLPHVEKRTMNHLKLVLNNYDLNSRQEGEIRDLIYNRYLEQVFNEQYYFYSPRKNQTIRAITYAFDKEYRKMIESYGLDEISKKTKKEVKGFNWE